MNSKIKSALMGAKVFLKPPHETMIERADALATAAMLTRQAIEHAVQAGRDDLAHRALALAHDMERRS